jgi:putative transposase
MFVARRWRRVKYEAVYLKDDRRVPEARDGLQGDLEFYHRERIHQSLNDQTPAAVYQQGPKRAAVTTFN